nr:coiled-coil domain-containing protein 62 isoform X1 [Pogona vitticeps]XP_020658280.1 coiled-coil domain-containing protein 62 isoform X1 [Pogona vitticeps]
MNSSLPISTPPQNLSCELESATIQKQRKELQLLIAELKDRDKELNGMVAVHQRQLLAWEDDRQKILTLAERCSKLEDELHKRNEMIKTLTKRLKFLDSQQSDCKLTLENTHQKLQELSRKASDTSHHCQALEEKNQALSHSVMELSNKVGQLQAREQELLTMLKLKDNDILEASNHITEFTCKFKKLERALQASKVENASVQREKQDFKLKLKELILETNKLKGDLSEKTKENNEQREEIIRLKQENGYLSNELMLSAERANRKDQLLQSAKSKQLRTDTELSNLRQIYMKQQQDLQFLHFNLESSQETKQMRKRETHEASRGMVLSDLENSNDKETACSEISQKTHTRFVYVPRCSSKNTCQVCRAESRQPADPKERCSVSLDQFQEGPLREPSTLHNEESKQSGSLSTGETDSRPASQLENAWKTEGREMARGLESNPVASLPIHEHWIELNSSAEPSNCEGDGRHWETGATGIPCGQCPSTPPCSSVPSLECCSCNPISKALVYRPVSDQEWMEIFKPVNEGGSRERALSDSPQASDGIKSDQSKSSDHDIGLNVLDLGTPRLTSTQKTSEPQRHERILDTGSPLELTSFTDHHADDQHCHPLVHHDSTSPTSQLQRLLAESRQMVADLELSSLLGASPCCSPSCSHPTVMDCTEALCKIKLPAVGESETKLSLFNL